MDPETIAGAFGAAFKNRRAAKGVPERLTLLLSLFVSGNEFMRDAFASHCESGAMFAERLGLPESVQRTIRYIWEQWDGEGVVYGLKGPQIPLTSRILRFAQAMEVAHRHGGEPAAMAIAMARRGRDLDPDLVDAYFEASNRANFWAPPETELAQQVIREIRPGIADEEATDAHLEDLCEVIADFIDIKSPFTWGHSRAVAEVAVGIGRQLGLDEPTVTGLRRASLVHDLGKVTVPCSALEKQANFSADEWEHFRLHPYYTERILSRVEVFKNLASEAGAHHERIDGSGYHRQLKGEQTTLGQRVLALADAYGTLAKQPGQDGNSECLLRQIEPSVGTQFDPECYQGLVAYLQGKPITPAATAAAGYRSTSNLSKREQEILKELAKGLRNREIAQSLVISEKTVERHLENIYNKLGITCRTSAVVYAVQNGLIS